MIGQVGSAKAATEFLQGLSKEPIIANVVFVASGESAITPTRVSLWRRMSYADNIKEKLDVTSSRLDSDWKMDEWIGIS
jgi:hypothetical protein